MTDPDPMDDLLLRSILGETGPEEESELREAFARDPGLLEKRRELAETSRLLAEVHGVPADSVSDHRAPTPLWVKTLRTFLPVGSGIAAGIVFLILLFPALDRAPRMETERREFKANTEARPDQSEVQTLSERGREISRSSTVADLAPEPESEPAPVPTTAPVVPQPSGSLSRGGDGLSRMRGEGPQRSRNQSGATSAPSGSEVVVTESERVEHSEIFAEGLFARDGDNASREVEGGSFAAAPVARPPSEAPGEARFGAFDRSKETPDDFLSEMDVQEAAVDPFASGVVPRDRQRAAARSDNRNNLRAGEKAKVTPPGGDRPLLGQSVADEAGAVEAEEVALEQKPAPPPPPPAIFSSTTEDPFSTFSLNVSDVSFQLAAQQLERGLAPDPRSIRQEEFYNAFDYRDPAPASGQPIRFEAEAATLPTGHNRKVVRLAVKTAAQGPGAGRPAQITFAVDNSGSMQRADRQQTIQAAFERLPVTLRSEDRINVVTFATDSRVELLQAPPSLTSRINVALNTVPEGGTNLEEGLRTAYEIAARTYDPAYENRVVLLSDGMANLGRTEADQLVELIETNRNKGIAFDGFGIGWEDLNDPLLSELARNGDGQYAFLNSPADAGDTFARALTGSLQSVARDVKVQVEWNADRVERFRLVGYETHLLDKEDFRNDAVDAAEMSAEETGNAIYLVELKPGGTGPLGTARVRFKMEEVQPQETGNRSITVDERSWIIPNPPVWPELDSASPALQLSTASAIFADKLQDPNRFTTVDRAQLLAWTRQAQSFFNHPAEIETLANMIRNATFLP